MKGNSIAVDEKIAIDSLIRVANQLPKSLWLFAAGGKLHVMKYKEDGSRCMTPSGGVDPDYVIETINIDSDGGDW